jgi:hypothetical protein
MRHIVDWFIAHPLVVAYLVLGVAGAVGKAKFTSPRWQMLATLLGAVGFGVHDAIQLALNPRKVQDDIPTNPDLESIP